MEERKQLERRIEDEFDDMRKVEEEKMSHNSTAKEQFEHKKKQLAKLNSKLKIAYEQNNDIQEFMVQERE